jgi:hypothetical protein
MIIFFQKLADIKLSGALKSSASVGSSHFKLQNHPSGIQFAVYTVHFLSFQSLQIFGGNQIPNSNTFTPDFLEAVKCHNSWSTTSTININIHNIIAQTTDHSHVLKASRMAFRNFASLRIFCIK